MKLNENYRNSHSKNTSTHVDFKSLYDAFCCFSVKDEKKQKKIPKCPENCSVASNRKRMYDRVAEDTRKERKAPIISLSPTLTWPVFFSVLLCIMIPLKCLSIIFVRERENRRRLLFWVVLKSRENKKKTFWRFFHFPRFFYDDRVNIHTSFWAAFSLSTSLHLLEANPQWKFSEKNLQRHVWKKVIQILFAWTRDSLALNHQLMSLFSQFIHKLSCLQLNWALERAPSTFSSLTSLPKKLSMNDSHAETILNFNSHSWIINRFVSAAREKFRDVISM